ncbi:MAG: family 10 glycosylhydrolase [Candidatus Cloacimonetes bacterium]|nr:family 10 glycosylhydrolase [Candidatus Cloacimonadota bacterium]
MQYRRNIRITILILILSFFTAIYGQTKAIWAPAWDLKTRSHVDSLITDAHRYGYNEILAQVRYRGDALYLPNRFNEQHYNPEFRSHYIEEEFDPLEYLLEKAAEVNIEVHAWVTVFVATPHNISILPMSHVYHVHPEWVIQTDNNEPMKNNDLEGAYLDPALPEVHDYLMNILLDIVSNYDIAGLHLDYIRYPGRKYGNNLNPFVTPDPDQNLTHLTEIQNWREQNINRFLTRLYCEVKYLKPGLCLSAAVLPEIDRARDYYAQNWYHWLNSGIIDRLYLMAYTKNSDYLTTTLDEIIQIHNPDNFVVGLRAWNDKNNYPYYEIQEKILDSAAKELRGIALFSYSGLKNGNYLTKLIPIASPANNKPLHRTYFVFGYIEDKTNKQRIIHPVDFIEGQNQIESDANGFFCFPITNQATVTLKISQPKSSFFSHTYSVSNPEMIKNSFSIDLPDKENEVEGR